MNGKRKRTSLFQQKLFQEKNTNSEHPVYEKTLIKEYDQGVLTVTSSQDRESV